MTSVAGPLDLAFTATIGVTVTGDLRPCVEVPGSVGILATGKAVRVVANVDGEQLTAGLLPTGAGGHLLSISAKLRKRLGKDLGDRADVRRRAPHLTTATAQPSSRGAYPTQRRRRAHPSPRARPTTR